jgi:trehalose 6-phosphate synthase
MLGTRHLFVSNRSPYLYHEKGSTFETSKAIGGLISTMEPAFRKLGGVWIGSSDRGSSKVQPVTGLDDAPRCFSKHVNLSNRDLELYYNGFANRALWPLCHSMEDRCRFRPEEWQAYQRVNRRFARAISEEMSAKNVVWIHDYHLALTPSYIRKTGSNVNIACFWHIPFPDCETFSLLPWRKEILRGLLSSGFIGFHIRRYAVNFMRSVKQEFPDAVVDEESGIIRLGRHKTRVCAVPLGIDFDIWDQRAKASRTVEAMRRIRSEVQVEYLALGVDRLDYTKGVLERAQAVERLLERNPSLVGRFAFLQICVPTRVGVGEYREYAARVDREVERINARFRQPGWQPFFTEKRLVPQNDLAAYYRAADVACVTPLRDGMNLVAKEFVASQIEGTGRLVLSRFAGAAEELSSGAILVDPSDPTQTAVAIERALTQNPDEAFERMTGMRHRVRSRDLSWWLSEISSLITDSCNDEAYAEITQSA